MKMLRLKIPVLFVAGVLLTTCTQKQIDLPKTNSQATFKDGINWEGENEFANYLARKARWHFTNVEFEKAYVLFEEAVTIDSTLFASHTALALLSQGAKKDYHLQMAKKFSNSENEVSKLFVSLTDLPNDSTSVPLRREKWAKMHALTDGPFVYMYYAITRKDSTERISEVDKLIKLMNDNKMNAAPAYNQKGYSNSRIGQWQKGLPDIEKYLELYPNGYNPFDSRAEFYLFAGDTTKAIEYYKKAIEKFPYAQSARNSIRTLSNK